MKFPIPHFSKCDCMNIKLLSPSSAGLNNDAEILEDSFDNMDMDIQEEEADVSHIILNAASVM
jgi:hypothetical protein